MAPAPGDAPKLPHDRLRDHDPGPRRDRPAQPVPSRGERSGSRPGRRPIVRPGLPRPRSGALAVGPRHADRCHAGCPRPLDRQPDPRSACRFLRRDPSDRASVRGSRHAPARWYRGVRGVPGTDDRAGWTGPGGIDRPRPGRRDPSSAARPRSPNPGLDTGRRLCLDDVAGGRPPSGADQDRLRVALGPPRTARLSLAHGRLSSVATDPAGRLPDDALGALGRCPTGDPVSRAAEPLILAIDLGTTDAKSGLFTIDGRLVGLARAGYPTIRSSHGVAEQDPEAWWVALTGTTRQLVAGIRSGASSAQGEIVAICCVGQGPTLVP